MGEETFCFQKNKVRFWDKSSKWDHEYHSYCNWEKSCQPEGNQLVQTYLSHCHINLPLRFCFELLCHFCVWFASPTGLLVPRRSFAQKSLLCLFLTALRSLWREPEGGDPLEIAIVTPSFEFCFKLVPNLHLDLLTNRQVNLISWI